MRIADESSNSTTNTNHPSMVKPGVIPQNTTISFSLQNAKVGEPYSAELQIQGET
jgi:hypothetical protein